MDNEKLIKEAYEALSAAGYKVFIPDTKVPYYK